MSYTNNLAPVSKDKNEIKPLKKGIEDDEKKYPINTLYM